MAGRLVAGLGFGWVEVRFLVVLAEVERTGERKLRVVVKGRAPVIPCELGDRKPPERVGP